MIRIIALVTNLIYKRQIYLPETRYKGNIGKQVASGSMWSGIEVGTSTILQFIRSIIFARILIPSDFGVLSLATIFTEFILIFANFGFNASVIYHRQLEKKDLSTCWWGNLFIDGVVALICILFALFSTRFADDDHTVSNIICLLAVQFLILSLGSVNSALLQRQFMFKQLAIAKLTNIAVAFIVAWFCIGVFKLGVYGLVSGMIFGNICMILLFFYYLPWLPSFSFSFSHLRRHVTYGGWFLGVNLVTYVNGNLDKAIVGTYLNVTQLGFYEYAANIPLMVANKLSQVLNSVLFPAFSSLQDNLQQLGTLLNNVYRYNAMLIYPILTGIALVAPDFVLAAYGEKWRPVIEPLRLFCMFGMLRIFINPFYALCNGIGKPRLPFKWMTIYLPINAAMMFYSVKYFGVMGAIEARLFLPLFMTFTLGWQLLKLVKMSYYDLVKAIWPALLSCALMSIAVLSFEHFVIDSIDFSLVRLMVLVPLGSLCYFMSLVIFFRSDVRFIFDKFKDFRSK